MKIPAFGWLYRYSRISTLNVPDQYGVKGATNLEIFIPNIFIGKDLSILVIPNEALCFQQIDKVSEVRPQLKLNQYSGISPPVNQRRHEGNIQNHSGF